MPTYAFDFAVHNSAVDPSVGWTESKGPPGRTAGSRDWQAGQVHDARLSSLLSGTLLFPAGQKPWKGQVPCQENARLSSSTALLLEWEPETSFKCELNSTLNAGRSLVQHFLLLGVLHPRCCAQSPCSRPQRGRLARYDFRFTDENTEVQTGYRTCPRTEGRLRTELRTQVIRVQCSSPHTALPCSPRGEANPLSVQVTPSQNGAKGQTRKARKELKVTVNWEETKLGKSLILHFQVNAAQLLRSCLSFPLPPKGAGTHLTQGWAYGRDSIYTC